MKYKIIQKYNRSYSKNNETNLYELYEVKKYIIKRKGTFLGFWHIIGDYQIDSKGKQFCVQTEFDSIPQASSFIKCWHKVKYGDNNFTFNIEGNKD